MSLKKKNCWSDHFNLSLKRAWFVVGKREPVINLHIGLNRKAMN